MRKKDVLAQNQSLFDSLEQSRLKVRSLTSELKEAKNELDVANLEIKLLRSKIAQLEQKIKSAVDDSSDISTADCNEKETSTEQTDMIDEFSDLALSEAMQYGSRVIGEIVVESARCANQLVESGCSDEMRKSLSNLIVCKSELAKSEILSICCSDSSDDTKKEMIDSVCSEVLDYFKSVIAQVD